MDLPHAGKADDGCPDAVTLAAYLDRTLTGRERTEVAAHLTSCHSCREVTSGVVRFHAETAAPELEARPSRRLVPTIRRGRSWTVAIAAGAAAVFTLAVALPFRHPGRDATRASLVTELIAASHDFRPLPGRLTGGFAYSAERGASRGPAPSVVPANVRAAAARIEVALGRSREAHALAAVGVARVFAANLDGAVEALQRALAAEPRAEWQSDLAAVYLARATRTGHPDDLRLSIEAAQAAVHSNPALLEARFNLALALEVSGRRDEAAAAWRDYLAGDATSTWADVARQHVAELTGH